MISYQPVQYKPLRYAPSIQVRSGLGIALGQEVAPGTGVTPGKIKAVSAVAGVATLAIAAATVWVGVTTGMSRKGLLGVAGWVVAASAGIAGLLDLIATTGLLVMPSADMQAAINRGNGRAASLPTTTSPL